MPAEHVKRYKKVLIAFLSHRDGFVYSDDTEFDRQTLSTITPEDICDWFKFKAFGTATPCDDALPTGARWNSLHVYKKAISYFIPNKHLGYNVETGIGNPTKSPLVNEFLRSIKRRETRAEGAPPQARRDISVEEFRTVLRIAEQDNMFSIKVRLSTVIKVQLHMIARVDDTVHILSNELKCHQKFDFALQLRLRWTKNCMEERDAPEQIVLGAMDSDFCVIAALAIYCSYVLEYTNAMQSSLLFCDSEETPLTVKTQISSALHTKILRDDAWIALQRQILAENAGDGGNMMEDDDNGVLLQHGLVGTHSIRKLGCTLARGMGHHQDELDHRGRWRNTNRISDRYTSVKLPVVDGTVAASLCVGGPAKYVLREGVDNVTDNWLVVDFVPKIAMKFGNRVALVLGRALLWAINEESMRGFIPDNLYEKLCRLYATVKTNDDNPIEKRLLVVYGVGGARLMIDEAVLGEGGAVVGGIHNNVNNPTIQPLIAQNHELRIQVRDLSNQLRQSNEFLRNEIRQLKQIVRRFVNQPAVVVRGFRGQQQPQQPREQQQLQQQVEQQQQQQHEEQQDDEEVDLPGKEVPYATTLSSHPRDLYQLWMEWEFGLEGRKAAKRFNYRERGRVKCKYSRRKIVWDRIAEMIRGGHTHHTAIDELYQIYGERSTVTEIIVKMRRDRMRAAAAIQNSRNSSL